MVNFFKDYTKELLPGVLELYSSSFSDCRGVLWTSFQKQQFFGLTGRELDFCHDKFVFNKKGVLRGIHGDFSSWKLVSCPIGRVFQVVVNCMPESPDYMRWASTYLSQETCNSVLIPPGFGNAFCASEAEALYHYKLSYEGKYNDHDQQFTIAWNDPTLGIPWPTSNPILSARDGTTP